MIKNKNESIQEWIDFDSFILNRIELSRMNESGLNHHDCTARQLTKSNRIESNRIESIIRIKINYRPLLLKQIALLCDACGSVVRTCLLGMYKNFWGCINKIQFRANSAINEIVEEIIITAYRDYKDFCRTCSKSKTFLSRIEEII